MNTARDASETRLEVLKLNELPPVPAVAHQFLEAVDDPNTEVRKLGAIIEQDPALTARIVGLANAAYFGVTERIRSAEEAIFKVLGINTAKSLALSMVLSGPFRPDRCPGFDPHRYWLDGVLAASAAQRLAPLVRAEPRVAPGEAYLCGLVHDLGLMAVAHLYPGLLSQAMDEAAGQGRDGLIAAERTLLGADHLQVSGWIGRKWHLPAPVVATMDHYVDPVYDGEYAPLVRLVGTSVRWVEALDAGEEADVAAIEDLGVPPDKLHRILDDVGSRKDELAAMARVLAEG